MFLARAETSVPSVQMPTNANKSSMIATHRLQWVAAIRAKAQEVR